VSTATDTYVLLRAFVDELARSGMRAACTSPGSRSAPLALTLASEPRLRCFSHIDERCAGFFAVGLAKASGLPVAIACTSGTAAAELLPGAIEAHEARVPLLLLTADRPPELRENGAGQAIDQLKLYGGAAKWFFDVDAYQATPERLRWMRTLACRAYATTLEGRPGVVHLNFALREPLVTDAPLPHDSSARTEDAPYVRRRVSLAADRVPSAESAQGVLAEMVRTARRGVVVAGRSEGPSVAAERPFGEAVAAFATAAGWPLLADPMSGARSGSTAVAHYDALLRESAFTDSLEPDLILRVGDLPVSKPLRTWLAGLGGVRQVALDAQGAWQDPASVLSDSLALEPAQALRTLSANVGPGSDGGWLARWRAADELAANAIVGVLGNDDLSEPAVAAELGVLLPPKATLFVSSSMPVRDVEAFWPIRPDPPRVLCNRGASGIDGVLSSAFGAAATGAGPTVLLIGDVALAHDIGGLIAARRLELSLTIVLLDNGGGNIFEYLPVATTPLGRAREATPEESVGGAPGHPRATTGCDDDIYTRHILTPPALRFEDAATLYGLTHEHVTTRAGFRSALASALASADSSILEVRVDRAASVGLHLRLNEAVSAVIASREA
jgi:2-succinyl-5-enolpyruvyl-6-hydroxy-3-cyclohexene-1-carboxylate synthase